jgi:hypothetical protein
MASERDATCETCRFFRKVDPIQHVYGDCHRQPPQFNFSAHFTEAGYESRRFKVDVTRHANGQWPNVHQDDWCGEHQHKDKTDEG